MSNSFNPLANFNQGFDAATRRRESEFKKSEDARLKKQRESFLNAKDKGEALKRLLVDQPQIGFAFMKGMQTNEQGLDALIQDSAMLKHQLEIDPSGSSAMALLQNRKQTLDSGVLGGGRNSFHTDQAISVLQNEGPEKLLNNMNKFISLPEQMGKAKERRVQNSRDVPGGTMITFSNGTQEFKKFGEDVNQAALDVAQRDLPKLTSSMQNKQLEFQESANNAYSLSDKTLSLANKFSKIDAAAGAAGSTREMFLNFVGGQDEVSNLRKDYTRIRNKLITANLPQGPATDKDIELIAAGFPQATANQAQIVDFLRAMSRGQEAIAKFNEFKSVFLQENGNITRAKRNFDFDGQEIKKGERLATAYKRISKNLNPRAESTAQMITEQPVQQASVGRFQIEVQ